MNKFRFDACLWEFPFLREILEKKFRLDHLKVTSIRVQRTDWNFYKRTLEFWQIGAEPWHWEELWAILPLSGRPVLIPTKNEDSITKGMRPDAQAALYSGEPIVEALTGFEDCSPLVLLVRDLPDPDNKEVELFDVTIYKPGLSIRAAIAIARAEESKKVRVESRGA